MEALLLLGAGSIGTALGSAWHVHAADRSMAHAATTTLQRGLAGRTLPETAAAGPHWIESVTAGIARQVKALAPAGHQEALEQRIAVAGLRSRWTVERL